MSHRYTIILHPEEGRYWVSVPALPGCFTQGDTIPETIARAQEAIQAYLESLRIDDEPIPEETEHPQAITIDVAALYSVS